MDFTVGGLLGALIANLFAAFKGNESKRLMEDKTIKVDDVLHLINSFTKLASCRSESDLRVTSSLS